MNAAQTIAATVAGAAAVTLAGGYCVHYNGMRSLFEPCRNAKETRNASGRCTRLIAEYADGSALMFTWSEASGARYAVVAP